MANHYFQFKQFTIYQQYSAMKVTTDACLFGAWVAHKKLQAVKVLDIGAGTGLLALMLAQQNQAAIYAVEIDENTCNEMHDNFHKTIWNNRLHAINQNILTYQPAQPFDFIITNPPFFENDLKSPDSNRNRVLHDTDLTLSLLVATVKRLLQPNGAWAVLLPHHRYTYFVEIATRAGFFVTENVMVQQTPRHSIFRNMFLLTTVAGETNKQTIVIKETQQQYSAQFQALLKDYYLFL